MNEIIFDELKSALLDQTRLLKRFYGFCITYQDFEYDEMGLNTDEAENEKRKAIKIHNKLIEEINKSIKYPIEDTFVDILKNTTNLVVKYNINESKKIVEFTLSIEEDSFTLEEKK